MKFQGVRKSIHTKIILSGVCIGFVFITAISLYAYRVSREVFFTNSIQFLSEEIRNEESKLDVQISEIENLQYVMRSSQAIQNYISDPNSESFRSEVEEFFVSQVDSTDFYDQLRILDTSGKEVVRVNSDFNVSQIVPQERLQDKSDRLYFQESVELSNNDIYISRSELNKEGSPASVEIPYTPVFRLSLPLNSVNGDRVGYLVTNVLVDEVLNSSELIENSRYDLTIVSLEGEFIVNEDEDREWGGQNNLDTGITLSTVYPDIGLNDFSSSRGSFVREGNVYVYRVYSFNDSSDKSWVFLNTVSVNTLFLPLRAELVRGIMFLVGTFAVIISSFGLVLKLHLRPLEQLAGSMHRVVLSEGRKRLKVRTSDEVGVVSKEVNLLLQKFQELQTEFELKVSEKTENLNEKIGELHNSQLALTNVLEDIALEKEKAEKILASIADGVAVFDVHANVLLMNDVAKGILGIEDEVYLGKSFREIFQFVDETGERIERSYLEEVFSTKKPVHESRDIFVAHPDRLVPISVSIAPLLDVEAEVTGVVVAFQDRTQDYAIDQAKSEFVSLAAHQLKTPVGAIRWNMEMLLDGDYGYLNESQKEVIGQIAQMNARMSDLIQSFLNISRIELGTFEIQPVSTGLVSLTYEVLTELREKIEEKSLQLACEFPDNEGVADVDPNLMRIILQNLISNAVKYSFENTEVSVVLEVGETIRLRVSNVGIGVKTEDKENIFTKFYRSGDAQVTDPNGNGLGLYIIKGIVESAGGEIEFASEEGGETWFEVCFPGSGMVPRDGSKRLSGNLS